MTALAVVETRYYSVLLNMSKIITALKLGVTCTDKATKLTGVATHMVIDRDFHAHYFFQPSGINPKNGLPIRSYFMEINGLEVPEGGLHEVEIPVEIIGSQVTNTNSGFTGMAVQLIYHINGCFHVAIQPAGVLPETQSPVEKQDFDLRLCSGEQIKTYTDEELARSRREKPSPAGFGSSLESPGLSVMKA